MEHLRGYLLFLDDFRILAPDKLRQKLEVHLATKLLFHKGVTAWFPFTIDPPNDSARTNTTPKDGVDRQPKSPLPQ